MHVNGAAKQADDPMKTPESRQAVRGNLNVPARAWGAASTRGCPGDAHQRSFWHVRVVANTRMHAVGAG